ncbi:MAG: hypothetical protein JJU42_09105 [Rhodobacteraceae bacterium]|nr:hypothetical protein [Paracoccaceae bacterium]
MQTLHKVHFGSLPVGDAMVREFAFRVVTELARSSGIQSGRAEESFVGLLIAAARSGDPAALEGLLAAMKRRRISAEQVIDIYFPCAISHIGTDWHNARIDVLQATLAMSRLQRLLRELGRAWVSDRAGGVSADCVLLLMPRGEQHVLGAMIAANQLRRSGVSVRVELAPGPGAITDLLRKRRFSAVFLSVSNESSVAGAAACVREVRKACETQLPIIIGGGLVSQALQDRRERRIAVETGADLATSDVHEALAFSGLRKLCAAAE